MKKIFIILSIAITTVIVSCEKIDDVPPVADTTSSEYKLPDPEILTDEDRAVISEMEAEYNENAK